MRSLAVISALLVVCAQADRPQPTSMAAKDEQVRYLPTWESLDSRPLPQWFDDSKIGIFIHFGVFSVPGYISEWFWCYWQCPWALKPEAIAFMKQHYPPGFTYQDFARDFRLEFFNATEWVELFQRAGARYAVLTSKHHEGYTLWPSKYSYSWNSVDVGPNRDVVGEFADAVRQTDMRLGLYHSYYEWFNPLEPLDDESNKTTRLFPKNKAEPELYELVNEYKPDLIWSDGAEGPAWYYNSTGFLAWLYNDSPVRDEVIVNDRWADDTSCKHGGYFNCADRYNPGTSVPRKWENAMTLDRQSWGYRRNSNVDDYMDIGELLATLAETVSNGGNLLVNVGPTKEGVIPAIMQERLHQMGDFLAVNGEAIYGSKMWHSHNDSTAHDVYYTAGSDGSSVYAILLRWPADGIIVLSEPDPSVYTRVTLLGHESPGTGLDWKRKEGYMEIWLPEMARVQHLKHAWVLKMTGLNNAVDVGEEAHQQGVEQHHEHHSEEHHEEQEEDQETGKNGEEDDEVGAEIEILGGDD